MKSADLLSFPESLLKWTGQHPDTPKCKFIIATTMMSVVCLIIMSVIFLNFYLSYGDPVLFLQNIGSFGAYLQVFGKIIMNATKKAALSRLIKETSHFWDVNTNSVELKKSFDFIFPLTLRLQKTFIYITFGTVLPLIIQAYFAKQLPLGLWLLEGYDTFYKFLFSVQGFEILFITINVVAFDEVFTTLCMLLITQFMLLKQNFRELGVADIIVEEDKARYLKMITSYIKHHQFLLGFSKNMADTYSLIMLVEYVSMVTVLCASMCLVLESQEFGQAAPYVLLVICCFAQLSLYCIPVDYITIEASNVSEAIYSSDWYSKYYPTIKNTMPLIIQRSQKEILFSAGGLYDINSRTLLTVYKIAWSISVATRSMKHIQK